MRHQIFAIITIVSLCGVVLDTAADALATPSRASKGTATSKDAAFGPYKLGMTFSQFKALPLPPTKPGSKAVLRTNKINNSGAFVCQYVGAELPPYRPSQPKFTFSGTGDGAKLIRIAADVDSSQLPKVFAQLTAKYGKRTIAQSPEPGVIAQWDVTPNYKIHVRQATSAFGTVYYLDLAAMQALTQASK